MAHPNLAQPRETIATLQRYHVSFDQPVVESLCQEFGCTARTAPTGPSLYSTSARQTWGELAWHPEAVFGLRAAIEALGERLLWPRGVGR